MRNYYFREEERPKFNIRSAGFIAILLLVLLLISVVKTDPFRLDASELQEVVALREARQQDMVFRFMDTPDNLEENPDAEFLSDANRIKQSAPQQTERPENKDPVSLGNSFELKQEPLPTLPSPPQPAQPRVKPIAPQDNQQPNRETTPEEPEPPNQEPPPKDLAPKTTDPSATDPFAPKPYRKLSKQERKDAQKEAQLEMMARDRQTGGKFTERFHNPSGRSAPQAGFSIDTAGHDLGPYLNILKQLVKSNWRIPSIARFEVRGFAVVDFKLHQDGRITDAYLYTDSGYEPLDTASLNAITGIYKAPPLPEHIDEPFIPIKFGFFYNMRPRY